MAKIRFKRKPTCKDVVRLLPEMVSAVWESVYEGREKGFVGYFKNGKFVFTERGGVGELLGWSPTSFEPYVKRTTKQRRLTGTPLVGNFLFHTHPFSGDFYPSRTDLSSLKRFNIDNFCVGGYDATPEAEEVMKRRVSASFVRLLRSEELKPLYTVPGLEPHQTTYSFVAKNFLPVIYCNIGGVKCKFSPGPVARRERYGFAPKA